MDLTPILPEISLVGLALLVIILDFFIRRKETLLFVAVAGLAVPALLTATLIGRTGSYLFDTVILDPYAIFFKFVFLVAAALVLLASADYVDRFRLYDGEYYALILLSAAGMMLMASTRELISIYIALELATIPLAVLAGLQKDARAGEAALKYLLLAGLSSAFLLYGMAILFGLTGTTDLVGIGRGLPEAAGVNRGALAMALVLLVAGLGFKISAVPFQFWTPDVYEGAPTPVTAYLSVASKMAGFALVLRFFTTAFATAAIDWPLIFAVLSVLSMTLGNIVAFVQTNIKRLLAYSSIAAAGYIMIGLASGTDLGASGLIFFLLSYAFTNLGAFIAVIAISEQIGSDDIADYAGLARRAPLLAFALTFCLVSLLGIPPTAGFVAKFYLFAGAVQQGLLWLAVIGVINSAISAYYYIKVVRAMYLLEPKTPAPVKVSAPVALALLASVAGVLLVFVFAWPIIGVTEAASRSLFLR